MAFEAVLALDVSNFIGGVSKASSAVQGLGTIFAVGAAAIKGMYSAMEAGGALVDLSTRTGVAIDKLTVLQEVFKQAGMAAEDVGPVIAKLQRNLAEAGNGSAGANAKLAQLDVTLKDLQGLGADEQLGLIGEKIAKIPDPAQRAAVAMELFGKSGSKLLSVFSSGGMDEIAKKVGSQARLLKENAGIFDSVTDNLGMAGNKVQGFFVGMASTVVPQLADAIDELAKIDLAPIGESLGEGIAVAIELIDRAAKKMSDLFKSSGELGKTQSVTGGAAFMGMGGMGGPGLGMAEQKAKAEAEAAAPEQQGIFDEIRAKIKKDRETAREKYKFETPDATPFQGMSQAKLTPEAGLSSLQKMGAIGLSSGPMIDPMAMQSVRIQTDIRDYMRTLVDLVKNPSNINAIEPVTGGGLVLAS
jgi:hypothetical protein